MKKKIITACKTFGTRFYTVSQIADMTGMTRSRVRHVLWKLEQARAITRFSEKEIVTYKKGRPEKEITYRNTKSLGKVERATAENGWDKMWQVARAMRRFTRNDLAVICGQNMTNVIAFTKRYRKSGHIRPNKECGREIWWTLIKDPGPKRPI